MIKGFLKALSVLSIIRLRIESYSPVKHQFWFLISFPLIGLLFGLMAMIIAGWTHPNLPFFMAWFIPVLWLLISGGSHFSDVSKSAEGVFLPETRHPPQDLSTPRPLGSAIAVVLILGKAFALLQAEIIDTRTVSLIVLLVPIVSRYTALMMSVERGGYGDLSDTGLVNRKPPVILGASLITLFLCGLSIALGLILIIVGLVTAVIVRTLSLKRLGSIPVPVIGTVIEVSEVAMLWISIICCSLGLNLSQFSLIA